MIDWGRKSFCKVYFIKCPICEKLVARRHNSTFCSPECTRIYYSKEYLKGSMGRYKIQKRTCVECGMEFVSTYKNKHGIFCSFRCGKRYWEWCRRHGISLDGAILRDSGLGEMYRALRHTFRVINNFQKGGKEYGKDQERERIGEANIQN
jgi:endogenous inhibitor of DNA gyrase (YacG/DUF329 family)